MYQYPCQSEALDKMVVGVEVVLRSWGVPVLEIAALLGIDQKG